MFYYKKKNFYSIAFVFFCFVFIKIWNYAVYVVVTQILLTFITGICFFIISCFEIQFGMITKVNFKCEVLYGSCFLCFYINFLNAHFVIAIISCFLNIICCFDLSVFSLWDISIMKQRPLIIEKRNYWLNPWSTF